MEWASKDKRNRGLEGVVEEDVEIARAPRLPMLGGTGKMEEVFFGALRRAPLSEIRDSTTVHEIFVCIGERVSRKCFACLEVLMM